jgi:hypothetical protein
LLKPAKQTGTLPALQHDPNGPEDVLKVDADDDAADRLRYLVATKSRVVAQRKLRRLDPEAAPPSSNR